MYPQQKFDKPGKSPFMDMDLVPVYAEGGDAPAAGVQVNPQLVQNLGVRTALAEMGRLEESVDAVGTIAFDERAVALVQSRTAAYVERLFVRAPLDPVRKGEPLARPLRARLGRQRSRNTSHSRRARCRARRSWPRPRATACCCSA